MPPIDLILTDAEVDRIADAVVSKLKSVAVINTMPAEDKPATKPAEDKPATKPTKAKKDEKPAEDEKQDGASADAIPDHGAVLAALKAYSDKKGRPATLELLAKYTTGGSDKAKDVPEDKRADLIKALTSEDEEF